MIKEVIDPNSGAILFKKDEESLTLEYAVKRIESLETKCKNLEKRLKTLFGHQNADGAEKDEPRYCVRRKGRSRLRIRHGRCVCGAKRRFDGRFHRILINPS